jgi:MoaA/NifB/PqqE/SkfB family radical SAM enzyme
MGFFLWYIKFMLKKRFVPREILFSPSTQCNLHCVHCYVNRKIDVLPVNDALKFLGRCHKYGINRVGFTGGEPFLVIDFVLKIVKAVVKLDMLFGRITTNGVWFKNKAHLVRILVGLKKCGFDGSISVSVDTFHRCDLRKVAMFIKTATSIFERADVISIVAVRDGDINKTLIRLKRLAVYLNSNIYKNRIIRGHDCFIRIDYISCCSDYSKSSLSDWKDKNWFKDDFCEGPGNIFFVSSDGNVSPCCGYANEESRLLIGSIRHSPSQLVANASKNIYVKSAFEKGLGSIRKNLEKQDIRFPGKTSNHCYFCGYLLRNGLLDHS